MTSPCSQKMIALREKNRILLDQLESNSILLERRLKELKHTARVARSSNKSWQAHPPSHLKRKYESWKTRNYSGQVSAALNAGAYSLSSSSSDGQELSTKYKQLMEDITSPAKRSKQNTLTAPRPRGKEENHCERCQSPLKSPTAAGITNSGKGCENRYCKTFVSKAGTHLGVTSQESKGSSFPSHIDSDHHIYKESSELYSHKYNMNDRTASNEQQRRTLEAVNTLIDYSPESVFLRRLKERSQAAGGLIAPANIRETSGKPSSETPPKKSQCAGKSTVGTNPMEPTKPSPVKTNLGKFSPLSASSNFGHGRHGLISDGNEQPSTKQAVHHSPRRAYKDEIRLKKNRKRGCYRKHCHCHVQKNTQSRKQISCNRKENTQEKAAEKQELTSPGDSTSSPCASCDGNMQQIHCPKTPLIVSDTMESLGVNQHDKKHTQPHCCCGRSSRWFDELNEFRQSHWFDCHAHPHQFCTCLDSVKNLEGGFNHPADHKCVHKYVLDDRLFARPLYADHQNNSRCTICHLPYNTLKSRTGKTPLITLPSTQQDPEFQVSIPLRSPRGTRPSVSGNVLSHKKMAHTSGRGRATPSPSSRSYASPFMRTIGDLKPRAPPPADSLALRYQKGVAK